MTSLHEKCPVKTAICSSVFISRRVITPWFTQYQNNTFLCNPFPSFPSPPFPLFSPSSNSYFWSMLPSISGYITVTRQDNEGLKLKSFYVAFMHAILLYTPQVLLLYKQKSVPRQHIFYLHETVCHHVDAPACTTRWTTKNVSVGSQTVQ